MEENEFIVVVNMGIYYIYMELSSPRAKIGIFGQKPRFQAKKKRALLNYNHVLATTGQSCAKKKVPFSQTNIVFLADFGCFFWGKNGFSA